MLTTLALAAVLQTAKPNPADVVGEWRWTNSGSVTNWNTTNGTYAGAGRGMTKHYVFKADGTFKQDALIQVNNNGHRMSAFITAEGRYEIHGDNIEILPAKGHQHGEDNVVSAGNYDRPMPADVLGTLHTIYRWVVRSENGKRCFVLHLSSDPKDDMVYAPVKEGK